MIAPLDYDVAVRRDINIQPGPESNKTESFSLNDLVSLFDPADNTSSHKTGDLNKLYSMATLGFHGYSVALIFFRSLVQVSGKKIAVMIGGAHDLAAAGDTVDMYVEDGHENADLYPR